MGFTKYVELHVALHRRRVSGFVRANATILFPVIFVGGVIVGAGWLASRWLHAPIGLPAAIGPLAGGCLFAGGFALYLWIIGLFAKARGTQAPMIPTQELVKHGPYAITRNPMMTSTLAMTLGGALWFDSWSFAIPALISELLYLGQLLLVEEEELEARFGEEYLAYKASTPFIVPRLWRSKCSGD